VLRENGGLLIVHEKAVPAMMGFCNTRPHHGGTANGQRKEAGPPAAAGQVVDRLDARVSHSRRFQASAKCREAEEIPPLGSSPVDLHPLADNVVLRRQPPREIRGGQGILCGLLSQTKTARGVLYGVREGRRKASHAHPAGIGGGDPRASPDHLRQAVEVRSRMSSMATFYSETNEPLDEFREGLVYDWPKRQQSEGKPPIRGRLLRIHSCRHKADVWLFSNVEDREQLPLEAAATCYRWRWENEGFFRTYKRTLQKVTLMSRTLRLVHREAEASMIATQLLLCQGALAMPASQKGSLPVMCSPRGVLVEARRDIAGKSKPSRPFTERISFAQRDHRVRTTPKQKREWPRRKPHLPPQSPVLLRLTEEHKIKIQGHLQAA
jgi:hypothetical protein